MRQPESSILLRTNRSEVYIFLFGAAVAVLSGSAIAQAGYTLGWVVAVFPTTFFSYLILSRVLQRSTLELSTVGFTYRTPDGTCVMRWSDVERFRVVGVPLCRTIELTLSDAARKNLSAREYSVESSNRATHELFLSDDYGLGITNLCRLLNDWRSRYTTRGRIS